MILIPWIAASHPNFLEMLKFRLGRDTACMVRGAMEIEITPWTIWNNFPAKCKAPLHFYPTSQAIEHTTDTLLVRCCVFPKCLGFICSLDFSGTNSSRMNGADTNQLPRYHIIQRDTRWHSSKPGPPHQSQYMYGYFIIPKVVTRSSPVRHVYDAPCSIRITCIG